MKKFSKNWIKCAMVKLYLA